MSELHEIIAIVREWREAEYAVRMGTADTPEQSDEDRLRLKAATAALRAWSKAKD